MKVPVPKDGLKSPGPLNMKRTILVDQEILSPLPLLSDQEMSAADTAGHVNVTEATLHGVNTNPSVVSPIMWSSDGILRQALLSPSLLSFPYPGTEKAKTGDASLSNPKERRLASTGSAKLLPPVTELPRPGSLPPPLSACAMEVARASSVPPAQTETMVNGAVGDAKTENALHDLPLDAIQLSKLLPPISEVRAAPPLSPLSNLNLNHLDHSHGKNNHNTQNLSLTDSLSLAVSLPVLPTACVTALNMQPPSLSTTSTCNTSPLTTELSNAQVAFLTQLSRSLLPSMTNVHAFPTLSGSEVSATLNSELSTSDTETLSHIDLEGLVTAPTVSSSSGDLGTQTPQKVSTLTQTDDILELTVPEVNEKEAESNDHHSICDINLLTAVSLEDQLIQSSVHGELLHNQHQPIMSVTSIRPFQTIPTFMNTSSKPSPKEIASCTSSLSLVKDVNMTTAFINLHQCQSQTVPRIISPPKNVCVSASVSVACSENSIGQARPKVMAELKQSPVINTTHATKEITLESILATPPGPNATHGPKEITLESILATPAAPPTKENDDKPLKAKLQRNRNRKKPETSDAEKDVSKRKKRAPVKITTKNEKDSEKDSLDKGMVEQIACFKCKSCPFLSLDKESVDEHITKEHQQVTVKLQCETKVPKAADRQEIKCPGCPNVFFAMVSLEVHLVQDHQLDATKLKTFIEKMNLEMKPAKSADDNKKKQSKKRKRRIKPSTCVEAYMDEDGMVRIRTTLKPDHQESVVKKTNNTVFPNPGDSSDGANSTLVIDSECENSNHEILRKEKSVEIVVKKNGHNQAVDLLDNSPSKEDAYQSTLLQMLSEDLVSGRRGRPRGAKNCGITALRKLNPSIHLTEKELGHKCNVDGCAVRLKSHDNIEYHRRCHEKCQYKCPECSDIFNHWRGLCVHLWRNHVIDMELFSCDQCGYKTYSYSKLVNLHKRIHSSERPFLCDVCGKGFKTGKQLRNHKQTIHIEHQRQRVFRSGKCEICQRHFSDQRMLRVHKETVHMKMRPFLCNFCGYSASSRSTLKMHMRKHTGEKPFECDQCDYRTADHNSFRRHKMRHSGEKPYKCPYCVYACIQSSTYKSHLKNKHPGQDGGLIFCCSMCPFRTIKHDNFVTHVADHQFEDKKGEEGSLAKDTTSDVNAKIEEPIVEKLTQPPPLKPIPKARIASESTESHKESTLTATNQTREATTQPAMAGAQNVVPQGPIIVNLSSSLPLQSNQTDLGAVHFSMYTAALENLMQQMQGIGNETVALTAVNGEQRYPLLSSQLKFSHYPMLGSFIHLVDNVDNNTSVAGASSGQLVQLASAHDVGSLNVVSVQPMAQDNDAEEITGDLEIATSVDAEEAKFKVSEEIADLA